MSDNHKVSFYAALLTIFLLPLFFIPTVLIPIGIAKTVFLIIVDFIALGAIVIALMKGEKLTLPKTKLMWGALVLPAVYLISAFASSTPKFSIFGYGLEIGTAASIVLCSVLFLAGVLFFRDRARLVRAYSALFLSFAIVALFGAIKLLSGGSWLTLGTFSGNIANPIGSWTDLATALGALSMLSVFALEMLPLGKAMGVLTWIVFAVSLILLAVLGFSTAWAMLLGAGLVLLVYFLTIESAASERNTGKRQGVWAAAFLSIVALFFVWNPTFSTNSISTVISSAAHVNNIDIRPSLSTTLGVAHSVLSKHPVLGSGPQTFDKDWLLYKSPSINGTAFWNTAFPFGYGLLPTAVATTGLLGTLAWLLFLGFFISLGIKILSKNLERRTDRFTAIAIFLIALFLWLACFLYVPSIVIVALAFLFTGLAVSAAETTGVLGTREFNLQSSKLTRFASTLVMIALIGSALTFGFVSVKKVLGVWYFEKALAYASNGTQNVDTVEAELAKALAVAPSDQYWSSASQVELSRVNTVLQDTKSSDADKQQTFNDALGKAIASLQNAITLNPTYGNMIALANLYESLVPAPFAMTGAYESALAAYDSAKAVHPASPEVPLLKARLELDHKNPDGAREDINEALALKSDYADAYFLLSQLEASQNNLAAAIKSAETGALLAPNNAGVLFSLGLLKYTNKDYAGAESAFGKALAITPDYANAKYYLGLTLDALGKREEAITQFEDLAKTNPDNATVTQALENLKAGKSALYAPTTTTKPKTAPISGQ